MASKSQVKWGGQWSIKKLESVEKYLKAFLYAMKNNAVRYGWRLLYIDAFCGSGSQHIKMEHAGETDLEGHEISDFVEGSAMRALSVNEQLESVGTKGFESFEFIDVDEDALDALRGRIKAEYPGLLRRCNFRHGDSNVLVPEILESCDWRSARGVIFIDPFRANFNRSLLEKVAETESLDVWFLFPLSAIGRMMAREAGKISESWRRKLDDFYGTHEWYETLYTEKEQPTLFDTVDSVSTRAEGYDDLLLFTTKWLQVIFGEDNVLGPLQLDANGSPLFALFAAVSSKNPKAIKLWKRIAGHILGKA